MSAKKAVKSTNSSSVEDVLTVLDLFQDTMQVKDVKARINMVVSQFPGDTLNGLRLLATVGVRGKIGAPKE